MTSSPAQMARTLRDAIRRRRPEGRDDSGLTTLEWLLIVAAVAGLAALAVVLVRNVVTETADELEGSTARLATAEFEADTITEDALDYPISASTDVVDMNTRYERRCDRLGVAFRATLENANPPKMARWTTGVETTFDGDYTDTGETPPKCEIL